MNGTNNCKNHCEKSDKNHFLNGNTKKRQSEIITDEKDSHR